MFLYLSSLSVLRVMSPGLLLLVFVLDGIHGAKILGLFPLPGRSHFAVSAVLMKELANRGHQVAVLSPFPQNESIPNYTDIDTRTTREELLFKHAGSFNSFELPKMNYFQVLMMVWGLGQALCDHVLQQEIVQKLIHSEDEHFDLIIIEAFSNDCFLGFAHKFKAPVIQVVTFGGTAWMLDWVGNPTPYSYVPDTFQEFTDRMNFWERLLNTLGNTLQKVTRQLYFLPKQQAVLEKYFSDYAPLPSISELDSSTSLILLNHHFSISYARPLLPNVVEVGGMHVKPAKKLPEDLQKFIDEAPEGVIYFSFGTGLISSDMPEIKIKTFLEVFSKLKQRILWKWEKDTLPGKPQNVKIGKWFPQSDILAHPNVRLFITHGGLLSTQETIHWGVPVVGIPMMGDQRLNMARAVSAGYGLQLQYAEITTDSLKRAVKEVIENPRYRDNAQRLSRIYRDQPLTPLQQAVFWTEYVIRHKGATHMRSAALDLTWYQYFLLDVIAVLALAVGSVLLIVFLVIRAVLRKLFGGKEGLKKSGKSHKKRD